MALPYEDVIHGLGKLLGIELEPSAQNGCSFLMDNEDQISVDLSFDAETILISSILGEIAPGAYREQLFKIAMQYNLLPDAEGSFAYSEQNNSLIFFHSIPVKYATAERALKVIGGFQKVLEVWKPAVTDEQIPQVDSLPSSGGARSGMFGL